MAQLTKKNTDQTYRHRRGWGFELWIENLPDYCGKILHVDEGKRGSLHFHMKKLETMYLQEGHVRLLLIDPEHGNEYAVELFPGDSIQIPRGQPHQIWGVKQSVLFEFSTKHEEEDS